MFTACYRRWSRERLREPLPAPDAVRMPAAATGEEPPSRGRPADGSPGLAAGGETAGRERFAGWARTDLAG